MTEKEKMINGQVYDGQDDFLLLSRFNAHKLSLKYNLTLETQIKKRRKILNKLFPNCDKTIWLQGPIQIDYGWNFYAGKNFYANFNFVVLDTCPIRIGDSVYIGPNVTLATPIHPLHYEDRYFYTNSKGRLTDKEYGAPITIGNDCWIASGVTICGGVKIGNGCVIGANSVVTHDIPDNSFAAGNPCKVIREITDKDKLENIFKK